MPVSTYVQIALYVLAAAGMTATASHLVHILQLEGYKNINLRRWVKSNSAHVFRIPIIVSLAGLLLLLFFNLIFPAQTVARIITTALLSLAYTAAMLGYAKKTRVKNAKKPLVMTSRVKRLFAAIALVYVIVCGALCVMDVLVLGNTVLAGLPLFLLMLLVSTA